MSYKIEGLSLLPFEPLLGLTSEELVHHNARRVVADRRPGFPCRVTLEDAQPGEELILVNHVSLDVPTPFRTAYAIYVRQAAAEPALYIDELPPVLRSRTLSLRGFDGHGMLQGAVLATPGDIEASIRELFCDRQIAAIHAHNAAYGCFAAKIERH